MKTKDIHIRINPRLLERFESALAYEGTSKTQMFMNFIKQYCKAVEIDKMQKTRRQYDIPVHLRNRLETHKRYEENPLDLSHIVYNSLGLTGMESLLDVGCGTGDFLLHVQKQGHPGKLTGLDQSATMIQSAAAKAPAIEWLQGDALKLPFLQTAYDRIIAMHMLYHIVDIEGALIEFKRILRPTGFILLTTNSRLSLPFINELLNRALFEFGYAEQTTLTSSFCIENASSILGRQFDHIEEQIISNALLFTSVEPIVTYISSLLPSLNIPDDDELRADMKKWLAEEARNRFTRLNGPWRDPKDIGIYSCR